MSAFHAARYPHIGLRHSGRDRISSLHAGRRRQLKGERKKDIGTVFVGMAGLTSRGAGKRQRFMAFELAI